MKLCVPPGCGAVSYAGEAIEIDDDGCVNVDDGAVSALLAHGLKLAPDIETGVAPKSQSAIGSSMREPLEDDIGSLNRMGLFALLKANGVRVALPITNEALRALARNALQTPGLAISADDAMEGS